MHVGPDLESLVVECNKSILELLPNNPHSLGKCTDKVNLFPVIASDPSLPMPSHEPFLPHLGLLGILWQSTQA